MFDLITLIDFHESYKNLLVDYSYIINFITIESQVSAFLYGGLDVRNFTQFSSFIVRKQKKQVQGFQLIQHKDPINPPLKCKTG